MKEYGKYENKPEGVPVKQTKVKSALLQTYITSLLCMVLCVTMFFGTSYAWFTSEVQNTGNEIYIGTLDVGLFAGNEDLSVNGNKLFDSTNTRWEPGYTALETITVVDEGDLAFKYVLNFTDGSPAQDNTLGVEAIAQWFDVWVYDHQQNNDAPTAGSYADVKAENGWKPVGTLKEVLGGKTVLEGKMEEADVANKDTAHTYTIALHMNGEQVADDQVNALNALMGQKISLTVKLVAHQMASEMDGFGDSNYDNAYSVSTAKELQEVLDNATGDATIRLSNDITGDITAVQKEGVKVTIDGAGKSFTGSIIVDGKSSGVDTAALTIQNVNFTGLTGKDSVYINLGVSGNTNTRYTNNVTVKNCTFSGISEQTAAIKSYTGGDKNLTIIGCTVYEGMHSLVQVANVDNLIVEDCKVYSKNGVNVNQSPNVIIRGCTFDVKGYAVRFGASEGDTVAAENYLIEKCTLKSRCEASDDAVIILRGTAKDATLTLTKTTIEGERTIDNQIGATVINN